METEVPFEEARGTFLVPVFINDTIALKFMIDSGASDVSIPADVASTLIRSGTVSHDDYIGDQTFVLADGSTVPSAEFRIRSLKIGTLVLHNVTASLSDPKGELLLGQSFLSRLSSWSIDNGRHVLVLKAAANEVQVASESGSGTPSPNGSTQDAAASEPARQATSIASSAQSDATARALAYLTAWSDPQDPDGGAIQKYYAQVVSFYGQDIQLDALMKQKRQFARRWPLRSYVVRPASLMAQCQGDDTCTVSGILDWQASNAATDRRSTGVANFVMRFRSGLIDAESGQVLSRQ